MKLSNIIVGYLESNKRLVIPQLGAFIVKEPGRTVIFSELLRRDDGVFRSLLVQNGMGELEAAGAIDRFVFDIRHALQHGGAFVIDGLGAMRYGKDNAIIFRHAPAVSRRDLDALEQDASKNRSTAEPEVSTSAKVNPQKHLRGLQYTTRKRPDDRSYAYASRNRSGRVDKFVVLALLAAAIAVAAIVYGYMRERQDEELRSSFEHPAMTAAPESGTAGTAAGGESGSDGQQ